jgi:hypothetical protein
MARPLRQQPKVSFPDIKSSEEEYKKEKCRNECVIKNKKSR